MMKILFEPVQPEWNQKLTNFNMHKPKSFLRNSIAYVYQFKALSTVESTVVLPGIPDGCVDIIFNMEGESQDCFIVPSPKVRHAFIFKTNTTYLGIRMLPLQTLISFDLSLKEINQYIQLPLFEVAPSFYDLYNQLLELPTLEKRLHPLEVFFLKSASLSTCDSSIIKSCIDISVVSKGNIHVKDLEIHTGYSERYLRTLFRNEIGIPPKKFLELIHFQFTLQEIISGTFNLEKHITENDFYDTSHFYKKFKKLTQMTPGEYRNLVGVIS